MIRLLAEHSPYLAAVAERRPEWLAEIERSGELRQRLTAPTMAARLEASLGDQLTAVDLAAFRRRQLLRIAIRDLLGYATLAETTAEISAVADAILEVTLRRVYQRLRQSIAPVTGFAVISLGKLGAQELNYSSDIDLMFLYEGDHTAESARKLATEFTALLSAYTAEGVCYRVDLRLRPDGKLGEVALPLEAALHYYRTRARDWELQMLIKGRCSAGDPDLARRFFEAVDPLTYSTTLDFSAVEAVSETRMRIQEKARARQKNPRAIDVKLTPGGIRDIEFLVQCLQRLHGGREASLRHGGTLPALAKLRDQELLSPNEYGTLTQAYHFLRQIEHRLQLEHDQQTHTLPESSAELERLAHRLGHTASDLLAELNTHLAEVQRLYDRVIHSQKPLSSAVFEPVAGPTGPLPPPETVSPNVVRLFDQIAPRLAAAVRSGRPRRNAAAFEFLLEKISTRPGPIRWIEEPAVAAHVFDLFEHAPHLADELTRTPEYLAELHDLEQASPTASERLPDYRELLADLNDAADLRRFFHREMFRIQSESVCLREPVYRTLERTSHLADAAIASAYRIAVWHVLGTHPPVTPGYLPENQLLVIALGRLGVREFDLGSDADLVFVLPDEESAELLFWTKVAERLIHTLTTYTGGGSVFSVDTRLRPDGQEGPLVRSISGFRDYFEKHAEAWEGIAYMKARAVAGDVDRATAFLNEIQDLDFRRYGQSGRSKAELRAMRQRLEKEQGNENPLKAGRGSYYDIDFSLMYLRLKGAGIFFKTLNTPERIDVVEKMGHLDRADSRFLLDAATFYRAVDHGIRLLDGHPSGALPTAPLPYSQLSELVSRWTPAHLHDQALHLELAQIQTRTREYFERLFA